MKKICIIFFLFFFVFSAWAQKFDIGAFGMGNTTWLLNKNVNNDGDEQDPEFTFVLNYGVNTAFFVSENFGFELDDIFGVFSQKYNGRVHVLGSDKGYDSRVDMQTMQLSFLLKFGSVPTFDLRV